MGFRRDLHLSKVFVLRHWGQHLRVPRRSASRRVTLATAGTQELTESLFLINLHLCDKREGFLRIFLEDNEKMIIFAPEKWGQPDLFLSTLIRRCR
jgi:hypothetical protein